MAAITQTMSSPRLLGRERDSFLANLQRSSLTFGEAVSAFSRCGGAASGRHFGLHLANQTHIPRGCSTIESNTMNVEPQRQPSLPPPRHPQQVASCLQPPSARSRTPSPWSLPAQQRPRSNPVSPRVPVTIGGPRCSRPHPPDQPLGEKLRRFLDGVEGCGLGAGRALPHASVPAAGGAYCSMGATEPLTGACARSDSLGRTARACSSGASAAALRSPGRPADGGLAARQNNTVAAAGHSPSCGSLPMMSSASAYPRLRGVTSPARGLGECPTPKSPVARRTQQREPSTLGSDGANCLQQAPFRTPSLRTSPDVAASRVASPSKVEPPALWASPSRGGAGAAGERGSPSPCRQQQTPQKECRSSSPEPPQRHQEPAGDQRVASFVRLNGFLLRTHITSLVSALAEDGWFETQEKERLCSHVREDPRFWSQVFMRIYTQFLETDDVSAFVAGLRAQIA